MKFKNWCNEPNYCYVMKKKCGILSIDVNIYKCECRKLIENYSYLAIQLKINRQQKKAHF